MTTIPQHHRQTDRTACTLLWQFSQGRQKFNTSIHSDNENLLLGTSVCHQMHYTFCLLVYECSRETRKLLTTYFKFLTNYNILFAMFDIAKRCKNKYRIAQIKQQQNRRISFFYCNDIRSFTSSIQYVSALQLLVGIYFHTGFS